MLTGNPMLGHLLTPSNGRAVMEENRILFQMPVITASETQVLVRILLQATIKEI